MPKRLPLPEFVALMAMLFASIAFSIDAMLPALPTIGAELTPDDVNKAQLVVTSFVFGMGFGTLITGPLSDAFGRKPVLLTGSAIYAVGAIMAWATNSLEGLLTARVIQGLGIAGPRIVALAIVRDLFEGREMARIMSFMMMVFSLVPALAPSLGAAIIYFFDWRAIFGAFLIFAAVTGLWLALRQAETLPPARRTPFRVSSFINATKEMAASQMFVLTTICQTLIFGLLMAVISSTQQVYDITFDKGHSFPIWFGASALISSTASLVNAVLVVRLGMRYLITIALIGQLAVSTIMVLTIAMELWPVGLYFWAWFFWSTTIFFMLGLTLGNLNALAMEPMGHIAGIAASVIGAVSTIMSVTIAIPIGLAFDGTPLPLAIGATILMTFALIIIRQVARLERRSVSA